MAWERFDFSAFGQIILQRVCDFVGKVQNNFFAAFAGDNKGVLLKIKIVDIQPDALADTDTRA